MELRFTVNGKPRCLEIEADRRLIDILREDLDLTGCKEGCGEGECGACTILLNDRAVLACLTLAAGLQDAHVTTIEGLKQDGELDILQQAFIEEGAVQCGFCTPGMILSASALLQRNPSPSEEEIRLALAGNICRCSGYAQIIRAVQRAAQERRAPVCE